MMEEKIYKEYCAILAEELQPAMGCTEPIAVAYCAALARKTLGCLPEDVQVYASANIIKNVKSVIVPNTGGLKGIRAAIAAGIITRLDDLFLRQHILSQPAENLIGELTRRSCTIGRRVEVISPTGQYEALAVAIAPDAGLIVELPDGSRRTVSSGEVSVRGLLGYT